MPLYENVFIARQDISTAQVEALTDAFASAVESGGGKVSKREYWGLRTLAYRIKKSRKGHYMMLNIDAPAETVHEMERQMRINEDILRYLTIRVEALDDGPSPMMQGRGRDERRRGDRGRGEDGPRERENERVAARSDRDDSESAGSAEDDVSEAKEGEEK
jgi:small subunit ribosomal protein S6